MAGCGLFKEWLPQHPSAITVADRTAPVLLQFFWLSVCWEMSLAKTWLEFEFAPLRTDRQLVSNGSHKSWG